MSSTQDFNDIAAVPYLQRPILNDVVYTISKDMVCIHSNSTSYVNVTRYIPKKQKDLLNQYSAIYSLCKEKKAAGYHVQISYKRGFKRFLQENWENYEKACRQMNNLYEQLTQQALKVQKRGIHMGTMDDAELDKLIKISWQIGNMYNRDQIISRIESIQRDLQSTYSTIKDVGDTNGFYRCTGCKVYL